MSKIPVKDVTPKNETQSLYAKREKIYMREIKGVFQRLRKWLLWLLMIAYYGVAWLSWDGRQAVLFDLPARQFHIFSITFWPQDFMLLAWILIICAFGLFTVTNLAGRIWCGYACPQTSWAFLFMWIEEKVEGSRNARIKLDQQPNSLEKIRKKGLKHLLWILLGLWTSFTFVGYFMPIRDLLPQILDFSLNGWASFWILFMGGMTYMNAGWLREQVCIYMCPYARFQSVMYDKDTYAVAYDFNRGEPRGVRSKKQTEEESQALGDCVDCSLCVQVCPVGIDIRDGLQYQCIGCALCIDACDSVMEKIDLPKGLIRYATEEELEGGKTHLVRPRLIGYLTVMLIMVLAFSYVLLSRMPFKLEVERGRGALYQLTVNDTVTNGYTLKLINMSQAPHAYTLSVESVDGSLSQLKMDAPTSYQLNVNELREVPVTLEINPEQEPALKSRNEIIFVVRDKETGEIVKQAKNAFMAPLN
ncbi:MAG: hypothetical protein RL217_981 [Pseudomonadota bacterium]|jgi:cytochrome c oxidase accessory protein FixG